MRRADAMGVVAAVVLALPVAACTRDGDTDDGDVVIAASLELSGTAADLGVAHERALRLKVDQINAAGGVNGRRVRLEVADNQTDTAVSLTQVTRFSADPDVTAIIVGSCSECAVAAAPVVESNGVPLISLAPATSVTTPVENRRFVFKLGLNVPDDSRALAAELSRTGVGSIGLLVHDDAYGADGRDAMSREAAKVGIRVTGTGMFQPGVGDLDGPARVATAGRPDAVVVWAFPVQAGLAARSLRNVGYKGRLFFDASAAGSLFLSGPAAAADGASIVFPQTFAMDDVIATTPAKAARKQWFEDYTSRYGSYHGHASFAADAVQLVIDAAGRAGSTQRPAIRGALETLQLDGLSGPIRLTPANHSGLTPQALTVLVARNGRWRLLG